MSEIIDAAVLQVKPQRYPLEEADVVDSCKEAERCGVMEQEMLDLHINLECLLPDQQQRVIQFVASQRGEGVSTIVREYAWLAANRFGNSVLILDACQGEKGQKSYYGVSNRSGWDQAVQDLATVQRAITRVAATTLYVTGYSSTFKKSTRVERDQVSAFFQRLKEMFDLVLIDSPPATEAGGLNFKHWIDGVVLVVEAEKTRWPVVENVKNRMISNGNRLLGLVINKRRNYIPAFIYKRL